MIGRHTPSISRGSALHVDAGGLLTPRWSALTPPSQAGGPSGDVGFELPGHSGEDRVGPAPTSRFCIAIASVAADHEAVQRDIVDDADASVSRRVTFAAPARDVSSRRKAWQRPPAASIAPVHSSRRTGSHAHRLVYSRGLDLRDPALATPIGLGSKTCERAACPQRASRRFAAASRPIPTARGSPPIPCSSGPQRRERPFASAPPRTFTLRRHMRLGRRRTSLPWLPAHARRDRRVASLFRCPARAGARRGGRAVSRFEL